MLSSDLLDGPGLDEETSSKSSSSSSHCATRGLSTSLELDDDSSPESPDSSYSEGAIAVILSKKAAKGEDGAWTKAEALETRQLGRWNSNSCGAHLSHSWQHFHFTISQVFSLLTIPRASWHSEHMSDSIQYGHGEKGKGSADGVEVQPQAANTHADRQHEYDVVLDAMDQVDPNDITSCS